MVGLSAMLNDGNNIPGNGRLYHLQCCGLAAMQGYGLDKGSTCPSLLIHLTLNTRSKLACGN